jgi:hypothetical protein
MTKWEAIDSIVGTVALVALLLGALWICGGAK